MLDFYTFNVTVFLIDLAVTFFSLAALFITLEERKKTARWQREDAERKAAKQKHRGEWN